MQNMSDDELDKLFKEAAEGFHAPQDSTAWQDMLRKLDKRPMPSGFWNWKTISTAAFIGLTGVGIVSYVSLENSQEAKKSAPSAITQEVEQQNDQALIESTSEEQIESINSSIGTEHNLTTSNTGNPKVEDLDMQVSKSQSMYANAEGHSDKTLQQLPIESKEIIVEDNTVAMAPISASVILEGNAGNMPETTNTPSTMASDYDIVPDSSKNAMNQEGLKDSVTVVVEKKKQYNEEQGKQSSIIVKLAFAPDFSSINYYSPDKSGFNYGVMLGYAFNNRWSVYTGAIYSKKIYSSNEIDEPYTSGGYDYEVTELNGDCRVIDIPINIYFTFLTEGSFSIQAGAGFSSYIMLQEDYTYYVNNPYGPDQYDQNIEHENNEWFKMLNVSVTLQQKLSNRFYLELEPFLKAPLAGVGEGEVSLVSMGAFFNLRFDIPIARKP